MATSFMTALSVLVSAALDRGCPAGSWLFTDLGWIASGLSSGFSLPKSALGMMPNSCRREAVIECAIDAAIT
jgi:hypothetical protein